MSNMAGFLHTLAYIVLPHYMASSSLASLNEHLCLHVHIQFLSKLNIICRGFSLPNQCFYKSNEALVRSPHMKYTNQAIAKLKKVFLLSTGQGFVFLVSKSHTLPDLSIYDQKKSQCSVGVDNKNVIFHLG